MESPVKQLGGGKMVKAVEKEKDVSRGIGELERLFCEFRFDHR